MSSLAHSVHARWQTKSALTALLPWARVFTGRVPSTELYSFPYCAIGITHGIQYHRTDRTRYSQSILSFHIWVDDTQLESGFAIAEAITDAYADSCWALSDTAKVIDVLDMGEPAAHQTNMPNIKAWEVIKLFTVCIQRNRADANECCLDDTSGGGQ